LRKIAYLTPLYFDEQSCLGGGERYPLNLAKGVVHASRGECQVELISYGKRSFRKPLCPGVTLVVLEAAHTPRHPMDVVSWELPSAIADADLVHFHAAYTRSTELGLLLARQLGKPICVTDHGGTSSTLGLELGILDLADQVITNSAFGATFYRTRTPIEVILGGVDADLFVPPPEGPRPARDRVLFVGRLLPHKGIDVLIDALPPGLPLTVCGRPYSPSYFENLQWRATGKDVRFVTDADDRGILDLYRRAWVNVLPSVYTDCYGHIHTLPELMGFTLLEAMACGTPVLCSRVGGMPEYIDEGQTGFVFDTTAELTERLRLLAGDPARVEQMGARARRVIEERFDLKVAGRRTLDVYRRVLARRREEAA
jgi:glycosyltransferase involved in cell wall biosynthesis